MAPKPKVPFALHRALRLRASVDVAQGVAVALSPDGAHALTLRGEWTDRRVDLVALADGSVAGTFTPPPECALEGVAWSRDGRRWAAAGQRFEGDTRVGLVFVGDREGLALTTSAKLSRYGAVSRNALARVAPPVVFAPDGERVVVRIAGVDDRSAIAHVSRDGVREEWLPAGECDLYALAFGDDGALYTATGDAGDVGGTAWYAPGADAPRGRAVWAAGCALVPGRRGVWVVGMPKYAWRVAPGASTPLAHAKQSRLDRARALRARAKGRWDEGYLDDLIARIEADLDRVTYHTDYDSVRVCEGVEPVDGARCFEHEMLWETSYADRFGDDDAIVSDGVAVALWRDDGAAITRTLLADDVQRATHRTARIAGLSTAGDTLALLWKRDARGAATALSLFEVDRAAL